MKTVTIAFPADLAPETRGRMESFVRLQEAGCADFNGVEFEIVPGDFLGYVDLADDDFCFVSLIHALENMRHEY